VIITWKETWYVQMLMTRLNNRTPYCFSKKVHTPEMTLVFFFAAAWRDRAYAQPLRESDDEDPPNLTQPEFSIGAIVEVKGQTMYDLSFI
jgi:hypothetical protein